MDAEEHRAVFRAGWHAAAQTAQRALADALEMAPNWLQMDVRRTISDCLTVVREALRADPPDPS